MACLTRMRKFAPTRRIVWVVMLLFLGILNGCADEADEGRKLCKRLGPLCQEAGEGKEGEIYLQRLCQRRGFGSRPLRSRRTEPCLLRRKPPPDPARQWDPLLDQFRNPVFPRDLRPCQPRRTRKIRPAYPPSRKRRPGQNTDLQTLPLRRLLRLRQSG